MDPQTGVARPSITPGCGIFVIAPGMLRVYSLPPVESVLDMRPRERFGSIDFPERAFVGRVLDVKHAYLFVSVLVYHPDEHKDGWINVWTSRNKFGHESGCRFATWSPPGGFDDITPVTFQRGSFGPPGRTANAVRTDDGEPPVKALRTHDDMNLAAEGNLREAKREIRLCDRVEIEMQSAEPPADDTIEVDYDPDGTNPDGTFGSNDLKDKSDTS
jgi:hypothetical protein